MSKRLTESQRTRIKYFRKLAKELPNDVEDRGILADCYMEHIEKIKKEKAYRDED